MPIAADNGHEKGTKKQRFGHNGPKNFFARGGPALYGLDYWYCTGTSFGAFAETLQSAAPIGAPRAPSLVGLRRVPPGSWIRPRHARSTSCPLLSGFGRFPPTSAAVRPPRYRATSSSRSDQRSVRLLLSRAQSKSRMLRTVAATGRYMRVRKKRTTSRQARHARASSSSARRGKMSALPGIALMACTTASGLQGP